VKLAVMDAANRDGKLVAHSVSADHKKLEPGKFLSIVSRRKSASAEPKNENSIAWFVMVFLDRDFAALRSIASADKPTHNQPANQFRRRSSVPSL
jgi:hypothetical protein